MQAQVATSVRIAILQCHLLALQQQQATVARLLEHGCTRRPLPRAVATLLVAYCNAIPLHCSATGPACCRPDAVISASVFSTTTSPARRTRPPSPPRPPSSPSWARSPPPPRVRQFLLVELMAPPRHVALDIVALCQELYVRLLQHVCPAALVPPSIPPPALPPWPTPRPGGRPAPGPIHPPQPGLLPRRCTSSLSAPIAIILRKFIYAQPDHDRRKKDGHPSSRYGDLETPKVPRPTNG